MPRQQHVAQAMAGLELEAPPVGRQHLAFDYATVVTYPMPLNPHFFLLSSSSRALA